MREAVRRHRFAFALIALLVAVPFLPSLVKGEVFVLRDHTDYFQPLRYFTAQYLAALELPYWNPYSASGEPWLANPQTGVFYPPTWLFVVLPFPTAYMAYLALHLILLGWGAYLLFARTVAPGAATVGAVAIVFTGPTLSLLDVQNNLATFAWIPFVMWAARARVPPQVAAVLLALAFLGGEPFFAAIAALLYIVIRRSPRDILIAGFGALGLSAIQLFPFLEMLQGSDRAAGLAADDMFRESMRPLDWLRVAVPPTLTRAGFDRALSQHFIPIIYIGIAIVVLAVLAWIFVRKREVLGWTAMLLLSIVVAAGSHLPVAHVFEALPLTLFRYPSRVVPFGALALVALAVLAWDRFRPQRRWADLVLILVLLVDLLPRAAPLLRTEAFRDPPLIYGATMARDGKFIRVRAQQVGDRAAWVAGYRNLYHRRFDSWTAAPVIDHRYERLHTTALTQRRLDLFQFLSVGYALSDRFVGQPFEAIARFRGVTVYENRQALPMARMWTQWSAAGSAGDALQALISSGAGRRLPVSDMTSAPAAMSRLQILPVRTMTLGVNQARVVLSSPVEAVLMIAQQDAPGWDVYVDGEKKKKILAGGVFRAVHVPAGDHDVIWRWNARSLHIGMVVTLIAVLSLQASAFVKRFKRRKFSS